MTLKKKEAEVGHDGVPDNQAQQEPPQAQIEPAGNKAVDKNDINVVNDNAEVADEHNDAEEEDHEGHNVNNDDNNLPVPPDALVDVKGADAVAKPPIEGQAEPVAQGPQPVVAGQNENVQAAPEKEGRDLL